MPRMRMVCGCCAHAVDAAKTKPTPAAATARRVTLCIIDSSRNLTLPFVHQPLGELRIKDKTALGVSGVRRHFRPLEGATPILPPGMFIAPVLRDMRSVHKGTRRV